MTRPRMIRADTLDLQDHENPSAKDHTKHPEHPNPLGSGRPAPHQEPNVQSAEQGSKPLVLNGAAADGNHEYQDSVDIYSEPEETDEDSRRNAEYDHEEDGDLADGESDDLLDDDLMDKLSSSPSIDDEDIDFEFVYALHNFIATVDGQANAAKGDTMVLLDDSNSYWWLVRVVKDGSIGYLPAEHIETPTERLARLNKHRNVDLSATMLGDNSEKSKNPLKKAMRRRNAKTVNFAPPTYIEASDVEYSTDDEDEQGDFFNDDETVESEDGDAQEQNEDIVVEPLRTRSQKEKLTDRSEGAQSPEKQEPERAVSEPRRSSEEFFDPEEPTVSRSRNGTVRNTDSFFKDDTAEPKKISLTPNLLRDETSSTTLASDWKDAGRGSFESTERSGGSHDKGKDDKKRKEKKPGMLSGLFKRKDKKSKSIDDEHEEAERTSVEVASRISPQPKASLESLSPEQRSVKPQRQPGNKLQKQQPSTVSPTTRAGESADFAMADPSIDREIVIGNQTDQSIRRVTSRDTDSYNDSRGGLWASPISQQSPSKESFTTPLESQDPLAASVERSSSEAQWREPYESTERTQPSVMSPPQRFTPKIRTGHHDPESPSPDPLSPIEGSHIPIAAPELTKESTLQNRSPSPVSPPSSPEVDVTDLKASETTHGSPDTLSVDTPTWSDASLRSYLDEETDIRDLFIIVHDKSNIPPAGPDHPVTGRLFKEESKRLKEMNNQLDEMLVKWMAQRKARSSTRRSVQSPSS